MDTGYEEPVNARRNYNPYDEILDSEYEDLRDYVNVENTYEELPSSNTQDLSPRPRALRSHPNSNYLHPLHEASRDVPERRRFNEFQLQGSNNNGSGPRGYREELPPPYEVSNNASGVHDMPYPVGSNQGQAPAYPPFAVSAGVQWPQTNWQVPGGAHAPVVVIHQTPIGAPSAPKPRDYMNLSILSCIFCFWPISAFAVYFAHSGRKAQREGDNALADRLAVRSRNFATLGCVLGPFVFVAIAIAIGVTARR